VPAPDRILHSSSHCVSETFLERGWIHRSCEFRNLCFDLTTRDFVLFQSPADRELGENLRAMNDAAVSIINKVSRALPLSFSSPLTPPPPPQKPENVPLFFSPTTTSDKTVAIGGVNPRWTWKDEGIPRLKWFPRIVEGGLQEEHYTFTSDDAGEPARARASQRERCAVLASCVARPGSL
jgi:hypothetical protein